MRLGINLPSRHADGTPLSITEVLTRARKIEEAGFDGIWIGDTVYRGQHVSPDPLMWLLAAATVTQRIELGVAVLQLPLREPFELAQRLIMLIGSWSSGPWVARAAREYDGWLASGRYTRGMAGLVEGIKRYRDAGGRRALIANVLVDLSAPTTTLTADGPFSLLCSPEEATARLGRVSELGYDDVLLMKPINQTEQDLIEMRALFPGQSS
jgi:alkanesulfonate monooxygenase SsuD/methylene tetrahydromethanopterin reductase-like flavin-dependent oxidoreductase (luciferase family)